MKYFIGTLAFMLNCFAFANSEIITVADCRSGDAAVVLFQYELKNYANSYKFKNNKFNLLRTYALSDFNDSSSDVYFAGPGINGLISKYEFFGDGYDKDGQIATDTLATGQVLNFKCDLTPASFFKF